MKSILYAGGAFMLAAGIYGFVDYKKTNANNEFRKMYQEKQVLKPVVAPKNDLILPAEETVATDKTSEIIPGKKGKTKKANVKKENPGQSEELTLDKELNPELFSRAPLRKSSKIKAEEKTKKMVDNPKTDQ